MKKVKWKIYAFWAFLTELVGALAALLTRRGTALYNAAAVKPALSPPAWVFPAVWSVLYLMMGLSAARISLKADETKKRPALRLYLLQLGVNFFWSILFFNLRAYGFAFAWLVLLWALIVWMALSFREIDRPAARLQIPYLLWVAFAGYLNLGVWMLNR